MAAVLVHIDLDGDTPHASSLVALAAGRELASSWGATLYAAMITTATGPGLETACRRLTRAGADKLVVATTGAPVAPLWATIGNAWQAVIDQLRPRIVLFGADAPAASELAPRTGARIGARLLMRARTLGGDGQSCELRDRDGGYVRAEDSGAAVAMIGRAKPVATSARDSDPDLDLDVMEISAPDSADARVEVATTTAAEVAHTIGTLVALGDDAAADPALVADAKQLASLLGAPLVGGPGAASVLAAGATLDKTVALAPALCIAIGKASLDLAGATSLVTIGGPANKTADAALPGLADIGVRELVKRLGTL